MSFLADDVNITEAASVLGLPLPTDDDIVRSANSLVGGPWGTIEAVRDAVERCEVRFHRLGGWGGAPASLDDLMGRTGAGMVIRRAVQLLERRGEWCDLGVHPLTADSALVWTAQVGRAEQRRLSCEPCFERVAAERAAASKYFRIGNLLWRGIGVYRSDWYVRRTDRLRCRTCDRTVLVAVEFWRGYCSESCRLRELGKARRLGEPDARPCEVCGEPFVPARRDARFCSAACRQAAYRLRREQRP